MSEPTGNGAGPLAHSPAQGRLKIWPSRRTERHTVHPLEYETFVVYARDAVETLRDGSGWEVEYPRDVWRLSKLPGLKHCFSRSRPRSHLRFDRITQPWLRDLGKRWVRLRLTSGLHVAQG